MAQQGDAPLIEAAWLYDHNGLNQNEIAERIQISRGSVVNYMSEARARGWVRVYLYCDAFLGHRFSAKLCDAYGLREALVLPDDPTDPAFEMARVTRGGRLAAPPSDVGGYAGRFMWRDGASTGPADDAKPDREPQRRTAAEVAACVTRLCGRGMYVNDGAKAWRAVHRLNVPVLLGSKAVRDLLSAEPVVGGAGNVQQDGAGLRDLQCRGACASGRAGDGG